QAIELARVIDRGMRESNAVDFKNLCIEKGEAVWNILIDVCTLNDAGNLLDAAGIGMLAALQNTYYPKLEDGKINYKEKTDKKLGLKLSPMPVTVYKLGSYFIVDPLKDEEMAADARLTVTTISDGTICALQKGGDLPLTLDDIDKMLDLAIVKANEIRKSIGDKNAKK
ncbi:RNA-binding protein, partial [archaeon]|nr:RNA-binding protein [archaeon]